MPRTYIFTSVLNHEERIVNNKDAYIQLIVESLTSIARANLENTFDRAIIFYIDQVAHNNTRINVERIARDIWNTERTRARVRFPVGTFTTISNDSSTQYNVGSYATADELFKTTATKSKKNPEDINVVMASSAFIGAFAPIFKNPVTVFSRPEDIYKADLVIFPGGEDINPNIYHNKSTYSSGINDVRDRTESKAFSLAREINKKVLGVCRGHQLLWALLGATLYQDLYIEASVKHEYKHTLELGGGEVADIFRNQPIVNSMHHQGIRQMPQLRSNFNISARYKNIPEIVESQNIITVQFHPEFMEGATINTFWNFIKEWACE